MVDRVAESILCDSCWMWPCIILRTTKFFLLIDAMRFLRIFSCTLCWCWKYMTTFSVGLQFKNSKWIMLQWSHRTNCITFLPWNFAFWVGCRDLYLSIHSLLYWKLLWKTHFLSPVMIFLRNESFLCLERRHVKMNMQSSLFFSLREWGTPMPSLLTFAIFFQMVADCGLLRSRANSWVLLHRLHSTNSFKYLEQGLMSVLVWVHLSMTYYQDKTLKTSFRLGNDFLAINTINFLSFFYNIFVIL